jgi:hypothetical protein
MARGKSNPTMFNKNYGKQTMYWGEKMARGKSNHTMFNKIMGNFEKIAGNRGNNIIFSPLLF